MEFTGTNLVLKRNIYPQTGNYSFSINCSIDNTTGKYFFGLSGNGNKIEFTLESGKIFFGNTYIHSYIPNKEFEISADFTSAKTNIRKDSTALVYGGDKTTGFFDYFYFKRDNVSLRAEFDLEISGNNIPSYSIQDNGYLFASGQNAVTGYFINNSIFPIRIFDSNIESPQPYSFGKIGNFVGAFSSGVFAYSGDFDSIDFSQPVFTTFNTTYGDATVLFTITDLRSLNGFVFLQGIDSLIPNNSGILNIDVNYLNYSGGFATTGFNASLIFVLDYVSGSGTFEYPTGMLLPSGTTFNKDFTGSWTMFTGVNSTALYSFPVFTNETATRITGGGIFNPNSFVNFQINHIVSGTNSDSARLTISGELVYNPISTVLDIANT